VNENSHIILAKAMGKSGSAEVREAGVTRGKKWEIKREVSCFLPGYNVIDWLSMVLRLRQHNIGYTADGFYRSDDPTNSVKALKEGG